MDEKRRDRAVAPMADKLNRLGVDDVLFYHNRLVKEGKNGDVVLDRNGKAILEPVSTACLLLKEGKVLARGFSKCAPMDQFSKRIGRAKALGRAVSALVREYPTPGWDMEVDALSRCYKPALSAFESRLVREASITKGGPHGSEKRTRRKGTRLR